MTAARRQYSSSPRINQRQRRCRRSPVSGVALLHYRPTRSAAHRSVCVQPFTQITESSNVATGNNATLQGLRCLIRLRASTRKMSIGHNTFCRVQCNHEAVFRRSYARRNLVRRLTPATVATDGAIVQVLLPRRENRPPPKAGIDCGMTRSWHGSRSTNSRPRPPARR